MNKQHFIQDPEQFVLKDIHDACAQNSNSRAKPKPSDRWLSSTSLCSPTSFSRLRAIMVACEECSLPEVTGLLWYRCV